MNHQVGKPTGDLLRVLIVDDYDLMRESLTKFLQEQDEIHVVGNAADGHEAVRLARDLKPDVVLMDVNMPGATGVDATRLIKEYLPGTRVIAFTTQEDPVIDQQMMNAGACAFLSKFDALEKLVQCVIQPSNENVKCRLPVGDIAGNARPG